MARIKSQEFGNDVDILINPENSHTVSVTVTNTGVTAGADGRKWILAGTPLYSAQDPLMNRETKLTVSGTNCQGFARHDIDVTDGDYDAGDTLIVFGFIDYLKLDTTVQSKIDTLLGSGSGATRLDSVRFQKGRTK